MSAHNAAFELFKLPELADPGNAGTIVPDRNPTVCPLVSTGAETRTLGRPTRVGTRVFIYGRTVAGTITLTVTGGFNEAGTTTFAISEAGQFIEMVSCYDGSAYFWRKTSDHLSAVAGTGSMALGDDEVLSLGGVARLSWDTTDANANVLMLQMPAGGGVDVPVQVVGQAIESVDLAKFDGIVDPTIAYLGVGAVATGPGLRFYKSRGTAAAPTVVTAGDDLGSLSFYTCVANGEYVLAAQILVEAQATQATTRGPGSITFYTATDAAPSVLTAALTISKAQLVTLATGAVTGNLTLGLTLTAGADGVGTNGEQLTSGGAAAETTWAAAGSVRAVKNIVADLSDKADLALERIIRAKVYSFRYKENVPRDSDGNKLGSTTGDIATVYHGVMADDYTQVAHHGGKIFNPISAFGETVLAFQSMNKTLAEVAQTVTAISGLPDIVKGIVERDVSVEQSFAAQMTAFADRLAALEEEVKLWKKPKSSR